MTERAQLERDLQAVALHESAHAICADEFGVFRAAGLFAPSHGVTTIVSGKLTAHQRAVVCCAGAVSEDMNQRRIDNRIFPTVPLCANMVEEYARQIRPYELSDSDWHGIAQAPDRVAAVREALEILTRRAGDLRSLANFLADCHRERFFATASDPSAIAEYKKQFCEASMVTTAKQIATDPDEREVLRQKRPTKGNPIVLMIRRTKKFLASLKSRREQERIVMMTENPFENMSAEEQSRVILHARTPDFILEADAVEIMRGIAHRLRRERRAATLALRAAARRTQGEAA